MNALPCIGVIPVELEGASIYIEAPKESLDFGSGLGY